MMACIKEQDNKVSTTVEHKLNPVGILLFAKPHSLCPCDGEAVADIDRVQAASRNRERAAEGNVKEEV